jgi:hypothetical protein
MNLQRMKILGAYLLAIGFLQTCLYLAMSRWTYESDWLLYFDPRIGIFYLENLLRKTEQIAPAFLRWLSAGWILLVGYLLLSGRAMVKTFIVSELILVLPNLCFFLYIIRANLSPSHGFSIGELSLPILVMVLFSFVPLWLAWWSHSKGDALETLNLS